MRVEKGIMVASGYGKYFRSDNIVDLDPIRKTKDAALDGARGFIHKTF